MTFRKSALLVLIAALGAMLAGCSNNSSGPLALAFSQAPTSLAAGSTGNTFAVTVTNDPQNVGVTWQLSCVNAGQCGTLTASGLTATYQAPVALPNGGVTVTATSVADTAVSASATVAITPASTLANGIYVFQLSGNDSTGMFNVSGAFSVSGGVITGGEQDFVDLSYADNAGITSGTILAGVSDSNLQIVLNTNDSNNVDNDTETIHLTQTSPTTGSLSWFDSFAAGNGTLMLQNAAAAATLPAGGYAFVTNGFYSYCNVHMGGVIDIDDLDGPGTLSGNNSVFDYGDCGDNVNAQAFSASNVAGTGTNGAPDQYGRVTFTLNPNGGSGIPQLVLAGYIVSSSMIDLVETADGFAASSGGFAVAQNSADSGAFSSTNLSGFSYSVSGQGLDPWGPTDFAGTLTFNSDGSVSGTASYNDIANQFSGAIAAPAGNYSVDSTGRVTVTNLTLTDTVSGNNYGTTTLQFYLDGNGNAAFVSSDGFDIYAGPAYQQSSDAGVGGAYAVSGIGLGEDGAWSAVGPITASSTGAVAGFTDFNYFDNAQTADFALSGSFSSASGTITGLGADSMSEPATLNFTFYPIDNNRAFGMETDDVQLGMTFIQFQN